MSISPLKSDQMSYIRNERRPDASRDLERWHKRDLGKPFGCSGVITAHLWPHVIMMQIYMCRPFSHFILYYVLKYLGRKSCTIISIHNCFYWTQYVLFSFLFFKPIFIIMNLENRLYYNYGQLQYYPEKRILSDNHWLNVSYCSVFNTLMMFSLIKLKQNGNRLVISGSTLQIFELDNQIFPGGFLNKILCPQWYHIFSILDSNILQ